MMVKQRTMSKSFKIRRKKIITIFKNPLSSGLLFQKVQNKLDHSNLELPVYSEEFIG